jgi:hypothetical protein
MSALSTELTGRVDAEPVVKTTSRKSFFRRLAEAKGSPAIDHEDVIIVRKPSHPA